MKKVFVLLCFFCTALFSVEIEISVPLYVNTEMVSDVPLFLDVDNDLVRLQDGPFKMAVYDYLTDEGLEKLDSFLRLLGYVSENIPKGDENFKLYFSTEDQSLHFVVELSLLRKRFFNVLRPRIFGTATGGKKVLPTSLSGYINLEGGLRNRHTFFDTRRPQGISSFGNFNWNIHFKDTIFTGFGYFLSENTLGINAVNAVLTKEFRDTGTKCSLGTINSLGISFQGSLPLVGFNLSKSSDLITDATVGAMSRHDIFLNAPSEVRVIVNGVDVNRLDLPAGSHTLQNFPLAQGLNNVILRIKGPTGEERDVDLSMFYNPGLLRVGDIETNMSVGVPIYDIQKGAGGFYEYSGPIAVSAYLKGGISNSFTLGGYFQLLKQNYFAGFQGIYIVPYFKTVTELGMSSPFPGTPSFRTRVAIFQPDAWKFPVTWNFSFEAAQKDFRYFGGGDTEENMRYLFSGSLGTYAYKKMSLNFLGQYGSFRDVGEKYSVQSTLSIRPKSWLSIRGILKWEESSAQTGQFETAVNLDITPRYKDFGTKVFYNTEQKALMSAITYNKALPGRRSVSGNIGYNSAPRADQLEGKFHYEGTYATLHASQQLMKESADVVNSTAAMTNANAATSLVFAGTKAAISRPIRESFVIISPNKYLRKSPVVVNPSGDNYTAKASYWMPAVVPMHSYSSLDVAVVQEDGAYGGSFEDTSYAVKSLNHSGAVIEVGDVPKLIVEATLFVSGAETEGLTGVLVSDHEIDGEYRTYRFFTDSEGVFQVVGVLPGTYTIKFMNKDYFDIDDVVITSTGDEFNFIYLGEFFIEKKIKMKKHKELRNE
ncbi:hypothetical protein K0U07_05505 [bacterium]|nr:hypothetical protein [bacterium]